MIWKPAATPVFFLRLRAAGVWTGGSGNAES
jgi:hypothetical protein